MGVRVAGQLLWSLTPSMSHILHCLGCPCVPCPGGVTTSRGQEQPPCEGRGAGATRAASLLAAHLSLPPRLSCGVKVAGLGVPHGDRDTEAPTGPASAPPPASKRGAKEAGEEVRAEPSTMSELEQLQQCDIPAGRQVLRNHHCNLHRVADYCESNYLEASDKRKALEETMALSTQSLASVTYQVSSLATAFLRLLDLQAAELRKVEADVSCVAQRVDMHKEKVSRREIGSLTVSKRFPSYQKIMVPPNPPCLEPYYRKPLNFSVLDDIGHGIKDHSTQLSRTGTLARKGIKSSAQAVGTLGRSARVPEPIQPPVVPEGKVMAPSASSLVSNSLSGTPTAPGEGIPAPLPLPVLLAPSPPPAAPVPPPPPLPGVLDPPPLGDLAMSGIPDPPPLGDLAASLLDLVPPALDDLEPPPPALPDYEDVSLPPPPSAEDPPWAPESYLEKVVTLYPYTRQKDNELSFAPGALLFVTRRYSDGWCEGIMGDEAGFFPSNYVEPF